VIRLIQGDSAEIIKVMPRVKCIFMDPPDNIGLGYADYEDRLPLAQYYLWLENLVHTAMTKAEVVWISYYHEHDLEIKFFLRNLFKYHFPAWELRNFLWRYTFGQHDQSDCGSGFRYMVRLTSPIATIYANEIRTKSVRQLIGDPRADPKGKVPDTVWDYSRVVGNATERRTWHPTQHNQEMMERLIRLCCSKQETFVDLFEGSGTSIRACRNLQVPHIGFEMSPTYIDHLQREHGITAKVFDGHWPY